MRNLNLHLLYSFVLLTACATAKPTRAIASIKNFPNVPQWTYFESPSLTEFFKNWNSAAISDDQKVQLDKAVFVEDALRYQELAEVFSAADARARELVETSAPIPKLIITKDWSANAYVVGKQSCISNVTVSGDNPASPFVNEAAMSFMPMRWNGETVVSFSEAPYQPCLSNDGDLAAIRAELSNQKVEFYSTPCSLKPSSGNLEFSCPGLKQNFRFQKLVWRKTLPFVFVNSGLIAAVDSWEQLEAILAHELGHYYLGHASTFTLLDSYFYDRENQTVAFRPPRSHAFKPLGEALVQIGDLDLHRSLHSLFRSPLSGKLLLSSVQLLSLMKDDLGDNFEFDPTKCEPLKDAEMQVPIMVFLNSKQFKSADKAAAKATFQLARECLRTVKARPSGKIGYLKFLTMTQTPEVVRLLTGSPELDSSSDAWDAFKKLDAAIKTKIEHIHEDPRLRQIGYYTFEEEADVFSENYLFTYGRSQKDLQSGLANLIRFDAQNSSIQSDDVQCLTAYLNNWSLNGKPFTPLPVDYSDAHHGFCFRLFNLDYLGRRLGSYAPSNAPPISSRSYADVRAAYIQLVKYLRSQPTAPIVQ